MRQKSGPEKQPAEDAIKDIRRAARRHFLARREDPRRAGRAPRRGERCRTLSPRRHRLVGCTAAGRRVPGSWQETAPRRPARVRLRLQDFLLARLAAALLGAAFMPTLRPRPATSPSQTVVPRNSAQRSGNRSSGQGGAILARTQLMGRLQVPPQSFELLAAA